MVRAMTGIAGLAGLLAASVQISAGPAAAATGWTTAPLPDTGEGAIVAIAARSANDAWALDLPFGGGPSSYLTLRWNGSTWSQIPTGLSSSLGLSSISASTASDAWIVGTAHATSYPHHAVGLSARWDGSAWSTVPTPAAGTESFSLQSVVDLGPGNAWAVGQHEGHAFAEHWNGTAWSVVTVPDPAGTTVSSLTAVSADGAGGLWAVGSYYTSSSTAPTPFSVHSDGTTWQLRPMQAPAPGGDLGYEVQAVSARAPGDVWAVGQIVPPGGESSQTLIEHWNGTTWSTVASPTPGVNPRLTGVVARTANDAWAVGSSAPDVTNAARTETVTLHWNGQSWSRVASPNFGDQGNGLTAVASAPGSADVWAGGSDGNFRPLMLRHTD